MNLSKNPIIWKEAKKYLNKKGVNEEIINLHLDLYQQVKPTSINDVYYRLLSSLTNRQGVSNWIGDINNLESFFFGFSPEKVLANYSDWKELIEVIETSDFDPPSEINKNDVRNTWVHFTKGSYEGAKFLSKFETQIEFNEYVSKYLEKKQHIQIANNIASNIHGIGFALACDFLKELGYSDFVKPDVHIIDIFNGLGLVQSQNPESVFSAVLDYANSIDEIPYRVDKLFWLIGSGYLYLLPDKPRISTDREEFCRQVRGILRKQGFEVKYAPKHQQQKDIYKEEVQKADFYHLNEMLTELKRRDRITAKQYRDYAQKWRNNEDFRNEIIKELMFLLSK